MSIELLVKHPKTFLNTNAVWVGNEFAWKAKGTPDTKLWPVTLRRNQGKKCTQSDGTDVPCWDIVIAQSLDCAMAFYLPYVPNTTKEMTLSTKGRLFITDTLDGCTFAHNGGGTAKVAHLNYTEGKAEGGRLDQPTIDGEVDRLFPTGASTLKKADYDTKTKGNVTVIGVLRPGGAWEFVYQRRDFKGVAHTTQEFQLISVHRIRG